VDEQIVADLKAARTLHRADIVIPFMHWGWEYEGANERQQKLARLMIDNGADVVVGSHPHVTQGAEYYNGKLIVYSLGNFVFDGFTTPESNTGWVLRLKLGKSGLLEWDTAVAKIDERGTPHLDLNMESPSGKAPLASIQLKKFQP
jgi:poly-gamma-glutamate capsule biosynthesis protein CapA/YwtB (metallophosphatase superfamily)